MPCSWGLSWSSWSLTSPSLLPWSVLSLEATPHLHRGASYWVWGIMTLARLWMRCNARSCLAIARGQAAAVWRCLWGHLKGLSLIVHGCHACMVSWCGSTQPVSRWLPGRAMGQINSINVVMRGKSNGHGWAVTQHGLACTYSWSSSIVRLQV